MYDVVISGAGPSGSHCAKRLAEAGYKVALIEKNAKWRKPCGGSVSSKVIKLYPQMKKLNTPKIVGARLFSADYHLLEHNRADNLYSTEMAFSFQEILNNYPSNVSMLKFKWGEPESYDTCSDRFNQYPLKYPIFIEVDDFLSPFYNVTKNFATLCPAGSTVYESSSDDSTIKTVSCKKGESSNDTGK